MPANTAFHNQRVREQARSYISFDTNFLKFLNELDLRFESAIEKCGIPSCGRPDVGLAEHAVDNRQQVGAGVDKFGSIRGGDATDSDDGQPDFPACLFQQRRLRLQGSGFGLRREEPTESHVAGIRPGGGSGALHPVVTGHADYRPLSQPAAGAADGGVILAKVYPGGPACRRQFDIIVDDQWNITFVAQRRQCPGFTAAFFPGQVFLAVLYHYRSPVDGQ